MGQAESWSVEGYSGGSCEQEEEEEKGEEVGRRMFGVMGVRDSLVGGVVCQGEREGEEGGRSG